jgi:DUF4097 and DUF4098 domain-containing protein YvlB
MSRVTSVLSRVILLTICLTIASCGRDGISINGYQFDRDGQTASRHEEGTIPAEMQALRVDNQFGRVRITATDGDPTWSWDLQCWSETSETAQSFVDQIMLQVDQEQGNQSWTLILPKPPVPKLRGVESNLLLNVPATVHIEVANQFGDTEILNVQGGTRARCRHSELRLVGVAGEIDAKTSFASLKAEQISGGKLANQHGSISVVDVGGDLEAKTGHDNIEIRHVTGELTVENSHGSVIAEDISGPATITTSFDDIRVDDIGGDVLLRNAHGDIRADAIQGDADIENEFGMIDLTTNSPEIECKNRHGTIKLNIVERGVYSVRAETSFANLEINVPASLQPKIQTHTSFGKVKSDFPVFDMDTGAANFQNLSSRELRMTLMNEHGDIRVKESVETTPSE